MPWRYTKPIVIRTRSAGVWCPKSGCRRRLRELHWAVKFREDGKRGFTKVTFNSHHKNGWLPRKCPGCGAGWEVKGVQHGNADIILRFRRFGYERLENFGTDP